MIDPKNIINYNRNHAELEELALFLVMVAGHNAEIERIKLHWFLEQGKHDFPFHSPLEYVYELTKLRSPVVDGEDLLMYRLRHWKIAPYGSRYNAFVALAVKYSDTNRLYTVTREELCGIPGISMKTASLFIMDTRPKQRMAALDTHILGWLAEKGFMVPKQSPQSTDVYLEVEKLYLGIADDMGMDPAHMDLEIWVNRSEAAATRRERAIKS